MIYTALILGSLLIPYEGDLSKLVYLSTTFPLGVVVFCLVLLKYLVQLMMLLVMLAVVFVPDLHFQIVYVYLLLLLGHVFFFL